MNSLHVIPIIGFFSIVLVSLFEGLFNTTDLKQMIAKAILIIVIALISLMLYFVFAETEVIQQKKQMLFWSLILLGYIPSIFLYSLNQQLLTFFMMTALLTTMIHVRMGLVVNFLVLILFGITHSIGLDTMIFYSVGGSFICLSLPYAVNRQKMVYVALSNLVALSLLNTLLQLISLLPSEKFDMMDVLLSGFNGFFIIILVYGSEPIWEMVFKITSSARLLELSNSNEPLLQMLLVKTPGTYHHSMLVANLAEKAAQDIQADYHLARVGALYHDIGKINHPDYFIENQNGYNIHNEISPESSAEFIKNHVIDGIQLAKEYKLPESIKDIIIQHQGDAVISYFYAKAMEHSDGYAIDKSLFVYPGPKPQSKEAAIVMLADCVEAAVKSLSIEEKNIVSIQQKIQKVTQTIYLSGQLNESPLLFKELCIIEASFLKVYNGMYHERIKYEREL